MSLCRAIYQTFSSSQETENKKKQAEEKQNIEDIQIIVSTFLDDKANAYLSMASKPWWKAVNKIPYSLGMYTIAAKLTNSPIRRSSNYGGEALEVFFIRTGNETRILILPSSMSRIMSIAPQSQSYAVIQTVTKAEMTQSVIVTGVFLARTVSNPNDQETLVGAVMIANRNISRRVAIELDKAS